MKIMLAGLEQLTMHYDLISKCEYSLSSYYYLRNKDEDSAIFKLVKKLNQSDDFILDSGAFTMHSAGIKDIDEFVEKYADFIIQHNIKRYIELDIDVLAGYDNVLKYRKYLEKRTGRPSIPCWHKSRGMNEYKRHVDEYDYVAIGGIAGKEMGHNEREYLMKPMAKYAKQRGVKVHAMGFTGSTVLDYDFYSADSTNWNSAGKFGTPVKFDYRQGKFITIKKPDNHRVVSRLALRHGLNEWLKFQQYAKRY